MSIFWLVYWVGVVMSFIITTICFIDEEVSDITLLRLIKLVIQALCFSVFSWVWLIAGLIYKYRNKIIINKK